jgi:hypothetical protein
MNDVMIGGAGAAASFLALRALQLGLQPTILRAPFPAVAGIEIVPASAWRLLDALELGGVLSRLDAGLGDGLVRRSADGAVDTRDGRSLHVERLALRRALLREAERHGARIRHLEHLPRRDPAACTVDATGQRAAWSRPVQRRGRDWADIFVAEGVVRPGTGALALLDRGWAYLASDRTAATIGVVGRGAGAPPVLDRRICRALGLSEDAPFRWVGRRAAFVQWATKPIRGRSLAIGDAAVHHNPIGGRGLAFALGSAFAAAAVLATWRDDPASEDAARYYEGYVASEVRRHLAFLNDEDPAASERGDLPNHVRWTAPMATGAVAVNGRVVAARVVALADDQPARWLGRLDLNCLREITLGGRPTDAVIERLRAQGLCMGDARSALLWALARGVIAASEPAGGTPPLR